MEADRPYRAYHHHLGGMPWEAIADLEHYPSASAVKSDVKRYLDEGRSLISDLTRKQLFEREMSRLDHLLSKTWAGVEEGHLPSINTAHGIVITRMKMLHFDKVVEDPDGETSGRTVVVVPEDDAGYSAALQAAAQVRVPKKEIDG